MKLIYGFALTFLMATPLGFAQNQQSANDIVLKMQHDLNLSDDQVAGITQIVQRYVDASNDLQKSIDDGTINPSAVESQKQQLKAAEDQGIAQYLRSDQVAELHNIQSQKGKDNSDDDSPPTPEDYSNMPKSASSASE